MEQSYFKAHLAVCKTSRTEKWSLNYEAFDYDEYVSLSFIKNHCFDNLPDGGVVISKDDYESVELCIGDDPNRKLHMEEKDSVNYDDA